MLIFTTDFMIGGDMGILRLAIEKQRWDLAGHTLVLAAARVLNQGVKLDERGAKTKKGRAKR